MTSAIAMPALEPFNVGSLPECPECGATGDYNLLKARALAVIAAWDRASPAPLTDSMDDRRQIADAINDLRAVIDMQATGED